MLSLRRKRHMPMSMRLIIFSYVLTYDGFVSVSYKYNRRLKFVSALFGDYYWVHLDVFSNDGCIEEYFSYLIKKCNQSLMRLTCSLMSNQINTIDIWVQFSIIDINLFYM